MNRIVLSLVAAVAILAGGYFALSASGGDTTDQAITAVSPATTLPGDLSATAGDDSALGDDGTAAGDATDEVATEDAAADTTASVDFAALAGDMSMGNPDAAITVVEYGSFTCPHCANFFDTVFGKLKTNYIDTDKVQFIHREVYFDRFGLWAGMVARCGGPLRYFGMVDILYGSQKEWIGSGENTEVITNLKAMGRAAGMNNDQLDVCLQNEEFAGALVGAYQTNAEADGITGTPSFMINGEKYSNMSYEEFAAILDEKLAE